MAKQKAVRPGTRGKQKKAQQRQAKTKVGEIFIRRILVPIDFSEHSKQALEYAIPFAQQFQASIDLLYVVEPTVYPADFSFGQIGFPNIEDELRKRGEEELENLVRTRIHKRVPAQKVIRIGKPFFEIIQYAREESIDLIIIATHGHTGVEHVLFGSTAEKVVRKAPCPVLVVRSGERQFIHTQR